MMLTCQQMTELVTQYLEGELGWFDWMKFQMHVGMCVHCRAYLRQMKASIALTGMVSDEPMPDEVRDELMDRFRNWKSSDEIPAPITEET